MAIPVGGSDYRVIDISCDSFADFVDDVLDKTTGLLEDRVALIPSVALREITENLVHALPCSATIVVDPKFDTLYISDTGPGISRLDLAFELGYSTATAAQRSLIRGVGLGLYIAREDLAACGGELSVDSSPGSGTFVRMSLASPPADPIWEVVNSGLRLSQRQNNILFLLSEGNSLGPSSISAELNIGVSTAHRELVRLQQLGLVYVTPSGKRFLSESGRTYLQSILSL